MESNSTLKCERCGSTSAADIEGEAILCQLCLSLVLREWRIRFQEFGQLTEGR
jgi:DNA-directed RNA polymerase subunit RPC12/RpoP